jgi:hypothetical protein
LDEQCLFNRSQKLGVRAVKLRALTLLNPRSYNRGLFSMRQL